MLALGTSSLLRKKSGGIAGLIGGEVFSHFGTVFFDFRGNRVVLK